LDEFEFDRFTILDGIHSLKRTGSDENMAEGARFENAPALETIGCEPRSSAHSESHTELFEADDTPIEPYGAQ
jgi:hypothetical protein